MKTTTTIVNPENVELAITFTMTVKLWRELAEQIGSFTAPAGASTYPSWAMTSKILAAVRMVENNQLVPKNLE